MNVGSEVNAPGQGLSIWAKSIRAWRAPFDAELISDEKRESIISNIAEVIAFAKEPLTVMR